MRLRHFSAYLSLALLAAFGSSAVPRHASAALVTAENLLVDLNASDPSAGTAAWTNTGSLLGTFTENGNTVLGIFGPNDSPGVNFDGSSAYRGMLAPAGITGAGTKTIEAWVFNPALNAEETMVSMGKRGGPDGTNLAFNYGNNATFGAVGHWGAPDMGWNGNPVAGQWHYLAYTYDGAAARVYADGQLKNTRTFAANTAAGTVINLGAQNNAGGGLDLGAALSGALGAVRIHDGVLTAAAIQNNFNEDAAFYGVSAPPPPPPPVGLVSLWQFNNSGDLGNDSIAARNNDVTPQNGASYTASGKHGGAVQLDGVDDMLDRAAFPTEVPLGNESYTVAAWIKPDVTGSRGIVAWGNYGTTRQVNALRLNDDNGFAHYWWAADMVPSNAQVSGLGVDLDDGEWHHIAAVYDNLTGRRSLVLDGQELAFDFPGPNDAQPLNFAIGRSCTFCNEFFDGSIDDVAIYDQALTIDQLRTTMTGDFGAFGGPVPEPSTLALAGIGAALCGLRFWRKRKIG
jgi:hypothetical protein